MSALPFPGSFSFFCMGRIVTGWKTVFHAQRKTIAIAPHTNASPLMKPRFHRKTRKGIHVIETVIRILREMSLFRPFRIDELETVAAEMHPVRAREGEVLIRSGAPADMFFVTIDGDYLMSFPDGRSFTLHGAGRVIGMNAILDGSRFTATATALSSGSLMALYREDMGRIIAADPRLADKISRAASAFRKQRKSTKNIAEIDLPSADEIE